MLVHRRVHVGLRCSLHCHCRCTVQPPLLHVRNWLVLSFVAVQILIPAKIVASKGITLYVMITRQTGKPATWRCAIYINSLGLPPVLIHILIALYMFQWIGLRENLNRKP